MLKLMTMNINGFGTRHGTWEDRFPLIRGVLEAHRPDIVALQAVQRHEGGHSMDQAAELAAALAGYQSHFQPARSDAVKDTTGLAFLSRLKMEMAHAVTLTHRPDDEDRTDRVLLHGRFQSPLGQLHVFNAYVSWIETQALLNLKEILDYVAGFSGPAVLMGDFNNPPGSPAITELQRQGWDDVWQRLYPEEAGLTFVENGTLCKRIDYIFTRNWPLAIESLQVVADSSHTVGVRPSDHCGLLLTIAGRSS